MDHSIYEAHKQPEEMQQPDKYRYYITSDALSKGTFPYMEESDQVQESVKPITFENGMVSAFGFVEYPAPLAPDQVKDYGLIPSSQNNPVICGAAWNPVSDEQRKSRLQRHENYLKTAEISLEQNYNQLDGMINNEQPRSNAGYTIIDCETVGNQEIVLAENPKAVQPFATWRRNISNDEQSGQENFFWGHYFSDPEAAQKDFKDRVQEQREDLAERRPSIRSQLKAGAARTDTPKAPTQEHKKDAPER